MKIAIVHNDYGKFSGEEAVVRDHGALLQSLGHDVVYFRRSSAELSGSLGKLKGLLCGLWNPFSRHRFADFLDTEHPDVVHIHNLYPLINPCVLSEAKRRHIPVVMTVHNFRLFCPNGLFAVDNHVCEECAQKQSVMPCVRKNCLGSRCKSLGYALRTKTAQHFRWYLDNVDRFFCLTEFQRDKLISYGLPAEKCVIIPNFIDASWLENAKLQVMMSRCYENFPTPLLQGMSLGIPAIVPNLGGMPGIVENAGTTFVPGDAADFCCQIEALWQNDTVWEMASVEAKKRVTVLFSPHVVGQRLVNEYVKLGKDSSDRFAK